MLFRQECFPAKHNFHEKIVTSNVYFSTWHTCSVTKEERLLETVRKPLH